MVFEKLQYCRFSNFDFRKFFNTLSYKDIDFGKPSTERHDTFFYNDSPYLSTTDTYSNSNKWIEQDSFDLFEANQNTGCKWAMSEFDHPFILDQAKERGLNVHIIGERQNLKNRRVEILVTNYKNNQLSIF